MLILYIYILKWASGGKDARGAFEEKRFFKVNMTHRHALAIFELCSLWLSLKCVRGADDFKRCHQLDRTRRLQAGDKWLLRVCWRRLALHKNIDLKIVKCRSHCYLLQRREETKKLNIFYFELFCAKFVIAFDVGIICLVRRKCFLTWNSSEFYVIAAIIKFTFSLEICVFVLEYLVRI